MLNGKDDKGSIDDLMLNDGNLCIWKIITELHPEYDDIYHPITNCKGYGGKKCPEYLPQKLLYGDKDNYEWKK
jgi:hypothetical protein